MSFFNQNAKEHSNDILAMVKHHCELSERAQKQLIEYFEIKIDLIVMQAQIRESNENHKRTMALLKGNN